MNSFAVRSHWNAGLRWQVTDVTKNVRSNEKSMPQRLKPHCSFLQIPRLKAVGFHGRGYSLENSKPFVCDGYC
jgi:hypothetical protein